MKGEATSPCGHGGFGGSLKAPLSGVLHRLERCMAGATGGSAACRSRCRWHGSNPSGCRALRGGRGVGCGSAKGMMAGRGRRMPSGSSSGVIRPSRHAAPTRQRSAATGRDATGGKTGGGYAAAFPSFAKLGLGRQKPAVFVVGGTACLPPLRGGANDSNIFSNNITRLWRGLHRRKSPIKPLGIHS